MRSQEHPSVSGFVAPGFEAVRQAFVQNFISRDEIGAACCMYVLGEKVVDLWGGIRNKRTGEPWNEDTMVIVFSSTKGMAGLAMALAHSRGLFSYDERVSTYWPEFAQEGKEKVTVRQLLSHQAGLLALNARLDRDLVGNPELLAATLAKQKPAWEPGTRQAYHPITLGFYESELLRHVDPMHRTLGRFFHDEIARPLGLDFCIGLPDEIPNSRLAVIERPISILVHADAFTLAFLNPWSLTHRAFWNGIAIPFDKERIYARGLEIPSQGGVGTARAMAQAYGVFATGGQELGLREETLKELMAPATPPVRGFHDESLRIEWSLSLGFQKPDLRAPFGSFEAFGTPGSGGSFGYADPKTGVGYAYVMNRMGPRQGTDPRELTIRAAFHAAIAQSPRVTATRIGPSKTPST